MTSDHGQPFGHAKVAGVSFVELGAGVQGMQDHGYVEEERGFGCHQRAAWLEGHLQRVELHLVGQLGQDTGDLAVDPAGGVAGVADEDDAGTHEG